jgi:hypothetical protein
MTRVNTQQTNFTAGELSPKLYGRSDLQAYFNGARRIENFRVDTAGQVSFRTGTQYVAGTKDNNKPFLYKFQFSDIQAYMLEFTEGNIRIYKDRGVVTSGGSPVDVTAPYEEEDLFELKFAQDATNLYIVHPRHNPRKLTRSSDTSWTLSLHSPTGLTPDFGKQDITDITQANPAVVTYSGDDDFAIGDLVLIENVVGMTEVNGNYYVVSNVNTGANTFELKDTDSTSFTAYTSGGDLYNADNFPSAVTFYEQRLIYGGSVINPETLWFSVSADPDDFTVGTDATDGIKYTVASGEGTNKIEWIRGTQDFLAIGGFDDLLKATGGEGQEAIAPNQISIKPTNTIGCADINPVSKDQYIAFMQRNGLTLRTFEYLSIEGIYRPIDRNIAADHITNSGVTQIAHQEGRPSLIRCIKSNGDAINLTLEREQEVAAWQRDTTQGEYISCTSTSRIGEFDDVWYAVKRGDNYYIEYENDQAIIPAREDYNLSSDESADNDVYLRALMEAQRGYIHLDSSLTYDGSLVTSGITLTIAAVSGAGVTFTASGAIFSASDVGREIIVKSADGSEYGRATISSFLNSVSVRCDIDLEFSSVNVSEWYLTADEISGADHLDGYTCGVVVDGAIHPDVEVSSGAANLNTQAAVIHIGLKYSGRVETMDIEGGGTTGTAQSKKKSVNEVGFRLWNTLGLAWGVHHYSLEDRLLRSSLDTMDNPPPLFTGDEVLKIKDVGRRDQLGWSRSKRIIFEQSLALPANIQMVVPYFNVSN